MSTPPSAHSSAAPSAPPSARPSEPTPTVEMRGVTKSLGGKRIVDCIDLEIAQGEFFSILGSSGCGKTTTLRMLGGFLLPDEGTVNLNGRDVTLTPPYRRDVNTVFQSYALFGHLDVAGNVAFGLKRKRVPRAEIARRVGEALELVALGDRAHDRPADLSGGQRQRVALARALVNMPQLLLLDEPLGALDLQLRRQMQLELKRIQREVGITFVYVTHDQEEALTMSDRIAVMRDGAFEQVGDPRSIYDAPATSFVAQFIGTSNVLPIELAGAEMRLPGGAAAGRVPAGRAPKWLSIRPEKLSLRGATPGQPRLAGSIADISYLGTNTHVVVDVGLDRPLTVVEANQGGVQLEPLPVGSRVEVAWHEADAVLLDR